MSMTVALMSSMDTPTNFVDVPEFLTRDGRADLKQIRRHLRNLGHSANRIQVTHCDAQRAPESPIATMAA